MQCISILMLFLHRSGHPHQKTVDAQLYREHVQSRYFHMIYDRLKVVGFFFYLRTRKAGTFIYDYKI